jgi:hypothetical protein
MELVVNASERRFLGSISASLIVMRVTTSRAANFLQIAESRHAPSKRRFAN